MPLRVTVIGTGYMGATQAACLAEDGCEVLGVDTDPDRVATLASGSVPFYEPGLSELVGRHVSTGRLRFTTSVQQAAVFGDVHLLCVGTPQRRGGNEADVGQLEAALDGLARHLRGQCLVIGRSTVPVGTARRLAGRLTRTAPADGDVDLAWSPEFLREGHAVADTLHPDRIVVGVQSEFAEKVLRQVYARQLDEHVPFVVTDLATAELSKLAANAFLATKVSYINAIAELCAATGADVGGLAEVLGHDARIGPAYLGAGLGFGGGCLPKDLRALQALAGQQGVDRLASLLRCVDELNMARRRRTVELAERACGGILGRRVCVLGAAFKPRSDDVRDSPALNVAAMLQLLGASVSVYDPAARAGAQAAFPMLEYATSVVEAARGAHLVLHLTEWQEFGELDPHVLDGVVARRQIIDGRQVLDAERWRRAGWTFWSLAGDGQDRGRDGHHQGHDEQDQDRGAAGAGVDNREV
jgi:UDPglucose 6-dehydrogenase